MVRGRGCLIAAALGLAVVAVAAGLLGPRLLREGQKLYAPVSAMKRAQDELKALAREHPFRAPAQETLTPGQLERFLVVRGRLQALYQESRLDLRDLPRDERPSLGQVSGLVSGIGAVVAKQSRIFLEARLNPAEYRYVERIVYRQWRPALKRAGVYPAATRQAADELERTAEQEPLPATAARLREIARELRARTPPAPQGVAAEVHALLLARLDDVERYSLDEFREIPAPDAH